MGASVCSIMTEDWIVASLTKTFEGEIRKLVHVIERMELRIVRMEQLLEVTFSYEGSKPKNHLAKPNTTKEKTRHITPKKPPQSRKRSMSGADLLLPQPITERPSGVDRLRNRQTKSNRFSSDSTSSGEYPPQASGTQKDSAIISPGMIQEIKKLLHEDSVTLHFMNNYKKIAILHFEKSDTIHKVKHALRGELMETNKLQASIIKRLELSTERPTSADPVRPLSPDDNLTLSQLGICGNQLVYVTGIDSCGLTYNSPSILRASSKLQVNPLVRSDTVPTITPPRQPKARTTKARGPPSRPSLELSPPPLETSINETGDLDSLSNLLTDFDFDGQSLCLDNSTNFGSPFNHNLPSRELRQSLASIGSIPDEDSSQSSEGKRAKRKRSRSRSRSRSRRRRSRESRESRSKSKK